MNQYISFIAMMVVLTSAAFGDVSANEQNSDVSLTITKFQVNDQTLELGWKITNGTDHDVWICDGLTTGYFECVLDKDNETLKIIKRSSLPQGPGWEHWPWVRFIRLRPGQEKEDSISLTVPVRPYTEFSHQRGNAEYARRVAIEIGFYDEDLRGLILNIVDLTEQLSCDPNVLSSIVTPDAQILERFFAGVDIAQVFHDKSFGGFRNKVLSDGDEIPMPFMDQFLHGEQVLRATIENVEIPYKSDYPPLTDEPPQSDTEPAGVTMVLTGFDVNDTNLELCYKIKNNTDHDVWVCNGYDHGSSIHYFERWMEKDDKTLVLRRRYNLSSEGIIVERYPSSFRYLRLRPGKEKVESHSFTLPVTSTSPLFQRSGSGGLNVDSAQCLIIEIGFYDEDLRALILDVVDIAERLGCDDSAIRNVRWGSSSTLRLYYRFFGGFEIAGLFTTKNISFFRSSVMSDGDEILKPPMDKALNGEQVLRIEVDNLSIPFSIL